MQNEPSHFTEPRVEPAESEVRVLIVDDSETIRRAGGGADPAQPPNLRRAGLAAALSDLNRLAAHERPRD
jgi:hypothetical protein